jgi:hypothetical protein
MTSTSRIKPTETELVEWVATEVWRPVPETDGWYDVSSAGRVRSWKTYKGVRADVPVIKGQTGPRYLTVSLCYPVGVQRTEPVHRLVARTFIGPRPDGLVIRHLDGNSLNNHISNLVYGTESQNARDRRTHGTDAELRKTHCPQGHGYTPENTMYERSGKRKCRTCVLARKREWSARRRRRCREAREELAAARVELLARRLSRTTGGPPPPVDPTWANRLIPGALRPEYAHLAEDTGRASNTRRDA